LSRGDFFLVDCHGQAVVQHSGCGGEIIPPPQGVEASLSRNNNGGFQCSRCLSEWQKGEDGKIELAIVVPDKKTRQEDGVQLRLGGI